ncbi:MAG TPA: DUF4215 domain-containing protein, partial [Polyangiaceae bacterium]|nr:DUF4215 domain-containing protein [Polyangiaceae bacterium]
GDTTGEVNDVVDDVCDGGTAGAGADLMYSFTTPDVRDVTITLTTTAHDGAIRLLGNTCDLASEIPEPGQADGCSDGTAGAGTETLVFNALPAGTYYVVVDGTTAADEGAFTLDIAAAVTTCGDGTVDATEGCDDMNTMAGDGCDAMCAVEPGYTCTGDPSVCVLSCGNGVIDAGEECDDGNLFDGDRCSMSCALEFTLAETEANDSVATANAVMNTEIVKGAIDVVGDFDIYELTLAADSWVALELYSFIDANPNNNPSDGTLDGIVDCMSASPDVDVRIFDTTGDVTNNSTALVSDDLDGSGYCGYVGPNNDPATYLAAGTYYIKVNEFGDNQTFPLYILDIQTFAPLGAGMTCDPNFDLCDPSLNLGCDAAGMTCVVPPVDRANYEQFTASDQDITNTQITYIAGNGTYGAYATPATAYPDAPGSGTTTTTLSLTDDDGNEEYVFGGGFTFPFFGTAYGSVFVNGNGNLTFGAGDTDFSESVSDHFDQPRISAFFDDLSPQNGIVTVDEFADHVTITYDSVPGFNASDDNDFQIQLFADGTIVVTYLTMSQTDGLIGVSAGDALLNPPPETDFSSLAPVAPVMGNLVINEFLPDPTPTADGNCDGVVSSTEDEFIELVNVSGAPLDLTGVTISDAVSVRHTFTGTVLPAGMPIVIYGAGTPSCAGVYAEIASTGSLGLNNGGDTITLSTGDTETYAASPDGASLTRDPDLTGMFIDHTMATGSVGTESPGFRVDGSPF